MGITVSDTAATIRFFELISPVSVTGPLTKTGPAVEAVTGQAGAEILISFLSFGEGGTVIELAEYRGNALAPIVPDNRRVGACHAAVVVPDIAAAVASVTAAGYRVTAAPQTATSGPMEGMRYTYAVGPDGLIVELLQDAAAATE